MKYQHFIFDLDGTLIDTETAILKTWQYTLEQYGYRFSENELKRVLGMTIPKTLKRLGLFPEEDLNKNFVENFEKQWIENYGIFARESDFFPGAKELLGNLKARGCALGIVTSRCKEEYESYFRDFHLEEIFDRIICADDTEKHKPDPEPVCRYVELEQAEPDSCIYIGDMPTDMECARRAGIASGLVLWSGAGFRLGEADYLFRTPRQVYERLAGEEAS